MKNHHQHHHGDGTDNEPENDGIDRRGFLECMAWAGTGVLWMMSGGILKSYGMSQMIDKATGKLKQGLVVANIGKRWLRPQNPIVGVG